MKWSDLVEMVLRREPPDYGHSQILNVFQQSPVNGAIYNEPSNTISTFEFPRDTWLQQRREEKIKAARSRENVV